MAEAEETPVETPAEPTAEETAKAEAEAEKAFAEGFEAKPTETVTPPVAEKTPEAEPEKVVEETPKVVEPSFAKITDAQWQEVFSKSRSVDAVSAAVEKARSDAFGKIGGLERTIKELQAATPVGQALEVSAKDLEELQKDFPDLTDNLAKGLTRVLSRFKGTAPVAEDPAAFDARVNSVVEARLSAAREASVKERAVERLTDRHPDWQEVVGPKDSTTEFRRWLIGQDEIYHAKILASNNPVEVSQAIDKFKEYTEKKKTKPAAQVSQSRRERLEEAVPAKGGSTSPGKSREQTAEEQFAEGYASVGN